MNKENLQRMADYIRTIPQEKFCMELYRVDESNMKSSTCNTIGCVIGHCTALDEPANIPRYKSGHIDFGSWSAKFTGINLSSDEWMWCFSGTWRASDDTPTGAALRIEWLIHHGLPENWLEQIWSEVDLCYK